MTGENNDFKGIYHYFKQYNENTKSCAYSGTTLGEYSLYPVDGLSLQSHIKQRQLFESQDIIILEYGVNDASSICANNVAYPVVLNTFRKCIDGIKQISPQAEIVFLKLCDDAIKVEAEGQIRYLSSNYLKEVFQVYNYSVYEYQWEYVYKKICELGSLLCDKTIDIMRPLECKLSSAMTYPLDDDGMHPDDRGYRKIAEEIYQSFTD